MLVSLDIRDILIIDRLELAFQPGLNVLTGETGAGKSILLDALGLALGWRGRADLVRQGAELGEVTAAFEIGADHPAHAVLADAGLPPSDELILRRTCATSGRKTTYLNDRRVGGETLRALSDTLVELHGQHDDKGLLDPKNHMLLLDSFAGAHADVTACRAAWRALSSAEAKLGDARDALARLAEEEDFLRHAVAELDALAPQPGEDEELDARRRLMQASEKIRDDVARARQALSLDGAEGQMSDAVRWLDGIAEQAQDALTEPLSALGRAMNELAEAQSGIDRALDAMSFNPADLELAEERLFAIRAMARKHGVSPDELPRFRGDLASKLADVDQGDQAIGALEQAVADARAAHAKIATALSAKRRKAAGRLDAAMSAELAPLKMERAVFQTLIEESDPGPDGTDSVTFSVATNPGAPAGPLNKIASGGELSRFLLALKVCLTAKASDLTLIFDEIDRGVGGATADAVGRRLAALAENGQILVVTHSPQVAALGAHHWRVEKTVKNDITLSQVVPLTSDGRVDEIARMLSGDRITDEARGAARILLSEKS